MPGLEELLADLAVRQPAVGPDPRAGGMQPRTPSLRENVAAFLAGDQAQGLRGNIIEKLLGSRGAGPSGPGPSGTGLIDYTPLVNIPFATNEARRSAEAGDPVGTTFNAMAMIPGAGGGKGPGKQLVQKLVEPATEVAKKAAKGGGRRAAITANSLRNLPVDEAIAQAKTGQHIIPSPKEGGFVGAPYQMQSMDDLNRIRRDFDADVAAGAPGGDWYDRAQGAIKEVAGPDPQRQSTLARTLALTSAQANPDTNWNFTLTGHNAFLMGSPADKMRTGQQAKTFREAAESGKDVALGPKTGIYGGHLDPSRSNPVTGTNDIWHARALGYQTREGKPWNKALTAQQHAFMDAETLLAVDRANQLALHGRTDWTPGEIQAAPWVAGKGRQLTAKSKGKLTPEEGLAEASKTYGDYLPKYRAYGTYEATPGAMTGHLPELVRSDLATRQAYFDDPRAGWRDAEGRDILYDALQNQHLKGAYQQPGVPMTGFYTPPGPGAVEEMNPGWAARPLVGFEGPSGERRVDAGSRRMLDFVEAVRAYFDAQGAGAWSVGIPGQKAGQSTAMMARLPSEMRTPENLKRLREIGDRYSLGNIVDQGDQQMLTNFMEEGVTTPKSPRAQAAFKEELEGVTGPGGVMGRAKRDSGYRPYEDAWEAGSEGSGHVTGRLQEMVGHETTAMAAFDASPEIRQRVLGKIDLDLETAAKRGDVVRPDVIRARNIFAEGGFQALFAARDKGLVPSIVVAGMVAPFMGRGGGSGETKPPPRAFRTEREF